MADAIVVLAKQFKENLLDLGLNPEKIYISSHIGMSKDENMELFIKILNESSEKKAPQEIISAIDKFKKSLKIKASKKK